jgi:hypothetical protein
MLNYSFVSPNVMEMTAYHLASCYLSERLFLALASMPTIGAYFWLKSTVKLVWAVGFSGEI